MKWIKNIYRRYIKASKENEFPISEYGFLGEKYEKGNTAKLDDGYFRLQTEPEMVICLDGSDVHGWLFFRHPDGQLVTKRKLDDWEVMQAEDQRDRNIVISTNLNTFKYRG